MTRQFGVAHLTLLRLTPPEIVDAAARAGYDFVGIRVAAVTDGEPTASMRPGSSMSNATRDRLDSTGVTVRDIEFLALDEHVSRDDWLRALESGAVLGASTFSVAGADPDFDRLGDTLAALVGDAMPFGILPTIEPISYQALSSLTRAATLAEAAGAGVLIDSLHLQRGGGGVAEVSTVPAHLIPLVQLCDAPQASPLVVPAPPHSSPSTSTSAQVRQAESRTFRLPPGSGELPLVELVAALPAETPLSVEVPNWLLDSSMEPWRYLELLLSATKDIARRADENRVR